MAADPHHYLTREQRDGQVHVAEGATDRWDLVIGLAAVVLGLVLLLAGPTLVWLVPFVAVALLGLGVLMFVGVLSGSRTVAATMVVLGLLVSATLLGLGPFLTDVVFVVVGLSLTGFGILRVF